MIIPKKKVSPSKVLVLKIEEDDLNTILLNSDVNDYGNMFYLYDYFAEEIANIVPEYAFAFNIDSSVSLAEITKKLREASKALVKIREINKLKYYFDNSIPETEWEPDFLKWYKRKGVFGELILHLILKEFKETIPLISKIYFKDSVAQEAKGFDSVHVSKDGETLWLGESKFYTDGKDGVQELITDLKIHFCRDFLEEQFSIIKRGVGEYHPQRDEWVEKLSNNIVLKEVFSYVKIPLLCVYEHTLASDFIKDIESVFNNKIILHSQNYKDYFDKHNSYSNKDNVDCVLILMPIESKDHLVKLLLEKIWHLQSV